MLIKDYYFVPNQTYYSGAWWIDILMLGMVVYYLIGIINLHPKRDIIFYLSVGGPLLLLILGLVMSQFQEHTNSMVWSGIGILYLIYSFQDGKAKKLFIVGTYLLMAYVGGSFVFMLAMLLEVVFLLVKRLFQK